MEKQKTQIIQAASKLFKEQGARRVSIDDICSELRISKKTFYACFAQKEDLIDEFIEYENSLFFKKVNKLIRNKNSIESLLTINKEMRKYHEKIPELFASDTKKYYPNIFEKHRKKNAEVAYQGFMENLKKGIEEGYYRNNLDVELFSTLYLSWNNGLCQPLFEKFPKKRVIEFFFDMSIQLIVSEKGLKYIEENYRNKG
jgi:AcrR family transcriptional regulator